MKIERKVFHRRDAEHTEMIHLFSLPLRRRQRKIVMPFGKGLISTNNLREALGLSLFCPLSRKGKNVFLSAISVPLAKRAVRHRSIHVIAKLDTNPPQADKC
jgi:hypothetical protein